MIKIFLIVTILSSGVTYSTQYEDISKCLNAKEEVLKINPSGIESYCITESDKIPTEFDRDVQKLSENIARKMLVTFQAVLTTILIDMQRQKR